MDGNLVKTPQRKRLDEQDKIPASAADMAELRRNVYAFEALAEEVRIFSIGVIEICNPEISNFVDELKNGWSYDSCSVVDAISVYEVYKTMLKEYNKRKNPKDFDFPETSFSALNYKYKITLNPNTIEVISDLDFSTDLREKKLEMEADLATNTGFFSDYTKNIFTVAETSFWTVLNNIYVSIDDCPEVIRKDLYNKKKKQLRSRARKEVLNKGKERILSIFRNDGSNH